MSLEENQTYTEAEAAAIIGEPPLIYPLLTEIDSVIPSERDAIPVTAKPKADPVPSGKTQGILRQFSTYLTPGRAMFLGGGNVADRFRRLLEGFVAQAKAKHLDSAAADRFVLAILTFHSTYRDQAIAAKKMQELVAYQLQRAWPRENPKKFIPITAVLATLYLENIPLWDELLLNQESKPDETQAVQALPEQADLPTDCQPGEEAADAGDTA